jgi:Flp pilus assembly protein TadG
MNKRPSDRGAVMIEFALIATLLFLLLSAVIDFGLAWRRSNEVAGTLRSAARVQAGLGNDGAADYQALFSLNSGVAEIGNANVERVIVYHSTSADGSVPGACLALTPSPAGAGDSTAGAECNVYSRDQLAALSPTSFTASGASSCLPSAWDHWFCPAEREDRQKVGADFVGIWMEAHYDYVVGALPGDGLTIRDKAIMRIEPTPE